MTNTVFSTVDRFASKFKLMDSLINSVVERLLPQQEAKGLSCVSDDQYVCQTICLTGQPCPHGLLETVFCCLNGTNYIASYYYYCGC